MNTTRTETDSFGTIDVPSQALWGAQTARSLRYFAIGEQRMPLAVIHAMAWVKWAAAGVNRDLGLLDKKRADALAQAAQRVALGEFDSEFPLSVWQTGSGTQSHMNVNEVVTRIANQELAPGESEFLAHGEVNLGQSSNDVYPTAVHMAAALQVEQQLLPTLDELRSALSVLALRFRDVVKVGRTHLQDATPVTLGQEFGGYEAQLFLCRRSIRSALITVLDLPMGGTAVGTGLNTDPEFGSRVAAVLARKFDLPFVQAGNLFAAMAGQEALVALHACLRMLAIALTKIGNDLRLMGSGPRAGLGELRLPANEPGSSIMPGKVNPTQIEALTMVCAQVMGHDVAIGVGASQGQFELNTYQPLVALNLLDSLRLLTDAMHSFHLHCVAGLEANESHTKAMVEDSLIRVTALSPHIGYQRAALIAQRAHQRGMSLREAALEIGDITPQEFDAWTDVQTMLVPTKQKAVSTEQASSPSRSSR
jgi:fumarate hydratase, class II